MPINKLSKFKYAFILCTPPLEWLPYYEMKMFANTPYFCVLSLHPHPPPLKCLFT